MTSPYVLPEGHLQIGLSGGRSSAFMLHQILEANGGLGNSVVVSFQNTGREMPQTLDFVHEIGERWRVNIVWLEYQAQEPFYRQVDRSNASQNGEPFEALIRKRRYLPNQQSRFCTTELKLRTAARYLRAGGWDYWSNAVGIRADEPGRVNKYRKEIQRLQDDLFDGTEHAPISRDPRKLRDRWSVWCPMAAASITKQDVSAFWQAQPFDLQLPNVNGKCWLGNCDGCFLKSEANIAALARDYPDRHQWWQDMERLASRLTSGAGASFSKRYTRAEMRRMVETQGDYIFDLEGALCQADDGECAA